MKPYKSPLIIVVALLLSSAHGTENIIVVEKNGAVIATDSLFYAAPLPAYQGCKIHQIGRLFWTLNGFFANQDIGFNLRDAVTRSAKQGFSARMMLNDLASTILKPLQEEMDYNRKTNPELYKRTIKAGVMLTIYVISQERGALGYYRKDFPIVNERVIEGKIRACPHEGRNCVVIDGPHEVHVYATAHPEMWTPKGFIDGIDTLMRLGADAEPDGIGPPVSILEIHPHSAKWLRQNDCEDIRVTAPSKSPQKTVSEQHGH